MHKKLSLTLKKNSQCKFLGYSQMTDISDNLQTVWFSSLGKDSKGWGNDGGVCVAWRKSEVKRRRKGKWERDGLQWRIKGIYDGNRVNPINIGTQEVSD